MNAGEEAKQGQDWGNDPPSYEEAIENSNAKLLLYSDRDAEGTIKPGTEKKVRSPLRIQMLVQWPPFVISRGMLKVVISNYGLLFCSSQC